MTTSTVTRRFAAALLLLVPLAFTMCFTLLQQLFDYPGILREPTEDILRKFAAGGAPLLAVWYALTLTAIAFVPLAVLAHRAIAPRETPLLLWLATTFGVIAGVAQTLGFLRWPFLVPYLAQTYLDPAANEAQRAAAAIAFEAFHRYAGMAVGEHLGYLSTSLWTLFLSVVLLRTAVAPRWLGVSGIVLALGIACGLAEPFGWQLGGTINAFSYLVWAVWLMALGASVFAYHRWPWTAKSYAMAQPTPSNG